MKGLVSIIVPVYNAEKYLKRCIESICAQTYRNIEILLIDDGSTDNGSKICDDYAKKDSRIKVIHKENEGVGSARNLGMLKANGEYVSFIDADDYVDLNYIEMLYEALILYNADISLCWAYRELTTGKMIIEDKENEGRIECFSVVHGYSYTSKRCSFEVWRALYRMSIIREIKFSNDLYVGEDTLFFAMAACQAKLIVDVGQRLYHYIQYPNSAIHGKFNEKKYTELEAWERVCKIFRNYPEVYGTAKCAYATKCYMMLKAYADDDLFYNKYYQKTLKIYRKNVRYFVKDKDTKWNKKVFRLLIAIFPKKMIHLKNWADREK